MHFDFLRKVFLTHLHTDHWGDLPGLWAGGWTAGRTDALEIWGPTGAREDMGTKYAVEHFLKAYNWDNMTRLANLNYLAMADNVGHCFSHGNKSCEERDRYETKIHPVRGAGRRR